MTALGGRLYSRSSLSHYSSHCRGFSGGFISQICQFRHQHYSQCVRRGHLATACTFWITLRSFWHSSDSHDLLSLDHYLWIYNLSCTHFFCHFHGRRRRAAAHVPSAATNCSKSRNWFFSGFAIFQPLSQNFQFELCLIHLNITK